MIFCQKLKGESHDQKMRQLEEKAALDARLDTMQATLDAVLAGVNSRTQTTVAAHKAATESAVARAKARTPSKNKVDRGGE